MTVIVNDTDELYRAVKGQGYYIYGTKTIAKRVFAFLRDKVPCNGFLLSQSDNSGMLFGKRVSVFSEEIRRKSIDCVIVAVSKKYVFEIVDELEKYEIKKIIIISPLMSDSFPTSFIFENGSVDSRCFIGKTVQIVADGTSYIEVEEGAVIGENSRIFLSENSRLVLGKNAEIGENSFIQLKKSAVEINNDASFSSNLKMVFSASDVEIKEGCCFDRFYCIGGSCGSLKIGKKSSFCDNGYIWFSNSSIEIGKDNMFSLYTKVHVGSHQLIYRREERILPTEIRLR